MIQHNGFKVPSTRGTVKMKGSQPGLIQIIHRRRVCSSRWGCGKALNLLDDSPPSIVIVLRKHPVRIPSLLLEDFRGQDSFAPSRTLWCRRLVVTVESILGHNATHQRLLQFVVAMVPRAGSVERCCEHKNATRVGRIENERYRKFER